MRRIIKRVAEFIRVSSKRKTKILSAGFVLILVASLFFFFDSSSASVASDITVENVVNLTNESRAKMGETALTTNLKLSMAAEAKAEDMIAKNYFSHTSPEGATPWVWIEKENYDYNYAGENLAMDFHSAEKMEEAWIASPTHRANILNEKYKEIGLAVREGSINGHKTILAVVMFGSGDKNFSNSLNAKKEALKSEKIKTEKNIPVLPVGEGKKDLIVFQDPIITSPQSGEMLSEKEVDIIGRARPGDAVSIFDNGNFVASAIVNLDGWFFVKENNLSKGSHQLALESKKIFSKTSTEFFVDQGIPNVDFRLYVDDSNPERFFLEASAEKNNCILEFNGETRKSLRGKNVLFAVDPVKSSAILRISDPAGNKNFRQINIANYYASGKKNISEKLAAFLMPRENIFAADSGREAVKNNLGLAMGGFHNH